jgi:membrane-bound lytic murein transglycosylase B
MRRLLAGLLLAWTAVPSAAFGQDYGQRPEVRAFIDEMVARHGFLEGELRAVFAQAQRVEPALQSILPEKQPTWAEFRSRFLNDRRIDAGLDFWRANRASLERAEREYGVAPQYVVAIIGVETYYGRHPGRYRVLDALTTLAFDYPARAAFFRSELEQYLLFVRASGVDVFSVKGSYAGAIGIPQFMPGSARRYAVDFDRDGRVDLLGNAADSIGSVANFLHRHGWRTGEEAQLRAKASGEAWRAYADGSVLPKHAVAELINAGLQTEQPPADASARAAVVDLEGDLRLGLQNFYVITRYNRSALYAGAVADLAQALAERRAGAAQSAGR